MMAGNDRLKYKLTARSGTNPIRVYGGKSVKYVFNLKQACEFCERSPATIRRWVDLGILPAFKTCTDESIPVEEAKNGVLYFLKSDLVNALRVNMDVPTEGFNV